MNFSLTYFMPPGAVDQNIEAAKALKRRGYDALAVRILGHVGEDGQDAARRADLCGYAFDLAQLARCRRHHRGAGVGKPKRHCSTEPAPATGDDGNSTSERQFLAHVCTTPLVSAQGARPWRDADTARENRSPASHGDAWRE
jgi:hypothetical protein